MFGEKEDFTMERKIPAGIQSFKKFRELGFIYIDKTSYVYNLVHQSIPFFLSRPRRFGKSLFLSTLSAYWQGKKELFKGLEIEALEENNTNAWQPNPVFYFDFDGKNYQKENALEEVIQGYLNNIEELYHCPNPSMAIEERFSTLLKKAHADTGRRCIVLVDEYDKPLLEVMDNPDKLEHNKSVLKGLSGNLKKCDEHIQFIFITGVTKFHKVSIFSDLNNLTDISLVQSYAGICGISEKELTTFYSPEIDALANAQEMTREECLDTLKQMYDGYHFHPKAEGVYNPYSLARVFFSREFNPYWYETGTPDFLIKKLKKINFDIRKFSSKQLYASQSTLTDYNGDTVEPIPLLYQSGYLTISSYDNRRQRYTLSFPNQEVKYGFLNSLKTEYIPTSQTGADTDIYTLDDYIENGDLEGIRNVLTALFASIPYTAENDPFENYFQSVIYIIFTLLGKFVQCEMHTYSGRIDCRVITEEYIYLFEFKRDDTADNALKQIDSKDYALPFVADHRTLYKIGVSFDSETRTLKEWKAMLMSH